MPSRPSLARFERSQGKRGHRSWALRSYSDCSISRAPVISYSPAASFDQPRWGVNMQVENGCEGVHHRCRQLLREIFSVGHFGLSNAKFCRHFKGQSRPTGPSVRISPAPPRISLCYVTTFSLSCKVCKPSVRFEEFRLRISPLRAQRKPFADHLDESRANSLVGSFVVRLRDGPQHRE
jgi:hypothetical protein